MGEKKRVGSRDEGLLLDRSIYFLKEHTISFEGTI